MKHGIVLIFVFLSWNVRADAQTYLLRTTGLAAAGEDRSALLKDYAVVVVEPLERGPDFAIRTYNFKIDGNGRYFFNLALEPADAASLPAFQKYARMIETKTFRGQPLRLELIDQLAETATFQTGNYDADQMDPFVINFQTAQSFTFRSLKQWLQFTDNYGNALLSKSHDTFSSFVFTFLPDPAVLNRAVNQLKISNMMAIDPRVRIKLATGEWVGADLDHTPFLPFRFFRNCYESAREGGNCL